MSNLRVLFFPCYVDGLAATSASVRWRAKWPAKYWDEADVYPALTQELAEYDAFVFQKAYLVEFSQSLIERLSHLPGKILAFDLCDADWLQSEEHEERLLKVLPKFDFAVGTTLPICAWLARWVPTFHIPDRLDLAEIQLHHDQRHGKPSLIWFGFSHNLAQLEALWPTVEKNQLSLTILSDACPEPWASRSLQFVRWTRSGADAEIVRADIALVPQTSIYKSDNRSLTAWALGLAVAKTSDQLEALLPFEERFRQITSMRAQVFGDKDVRRSAGQWKILLQNCVHKKKGTSADGE